MRWLAIGGVLVCAIGGAALWLLDSGGSQGALKPPVVAPARARAGTPPPPPRDALVLARSLGNVAVGLAAQRNAGEIRVTATFVRPDGTGLDGLRVIVTAGARRFPAALACGAGCYSASARLAGAPTRVALAVTGRGRAPATVRFTLPARWPVDAAPLLRRAERVFARLHSVVYRERLSSGPGFSETSVWRDEAPDRLSYRSATGDAGVVIGARRWDLVVGGSWKRSLQNPPLALPVVPWGAGAYDVSLLGSGRLGGRAVVRFSMFEPTTPAWYTVTLDRSSARTLEVDMTATAHFMQDRYVAFDTPVRIRPPAGR